MVAVAVANGPEAKGVVAAAADPLLETCLVAAVVAAVVASNLKNQVRTRKA